MDLAVCDPQKAVKFNHSLTHPGDVKNRGNSRHDIYLNQVKYRQISNISRTAYQNLDVSRPVLQLSLTNLLKPCIKLRMKM